ncbi:hypothetical protein P0Y35_13695 [Kiritimatiellaeota bacterium B1221]|nr:hypothetical protein [Kiritimatiellaeota bacterium B1221]
MKHKFFLTVLFVLLPLLTHADSSLTAYASYWDTDKAGEGDGYGARLKSTFLAFGSVEIRGGAIDMDDNITTLYPVDLSVNVRIPFLISPYAGVGAGYTFVDSPRPAYNDMNTLYAHLGLEVTFVWFGLMAEVRAVDAEDNDFDGVSGNVGVLIKW